MLIATDFHAPNEHELKQTLSDIILPPGMLIAPGCQYRLVRDHESEDGAFRFGTRINLPLLRTGSPEGAMEGRC